MRTGLPRAPSLAVTGALLLASTGARAEASDPVAAEQLFEAGRVAMERQDYGVACQRFAESERLDPAAGTLINLAECYDRQGLVASSWQRWKEALDALRPGDERRSAVEKRVTAELARLPKLELRLADGAPPDAVVKRDELTLGAASLGLALPVDPGTHHVVVTASGHEPREYTLTIAEAESQTVTVEAGAAKPETRAVPEAAAPPAGPTQRPKTDAASSPPESSSRGARTWGIALVSVGAAGLIVGGTAGFLALSRKHTMDDDCSRTNGTLFCGDRGLDAASSGRTFATMANVGVALGVVGVGVGGYLLLSSGSGGSKTVVSARSAPSGATLDVTQVF